MDAIISYCRGSSEHAETHLKFRLYYEGRLLSTRGRPERGQIDRRAPHKHYVRKYFHRQLKQLWDSHPSLAYWREDRRQGGTTTVEKLTSKFRNDEFNWLPLVTEDLQVHCTLSVLYLRPKVPYVLTAGDLDNRIKTLIDALKMPKTGELAPETVPEADENPFYILLEDDSLVTGLTVESDTLFMPTDHALGDNDSRVVVTVDMRPYVGTPANLSVI